MSSKFSKRLAAILIFISAVSAFYIWRFTSSRDLDLKIEAPSEILSGAPFELRVSFTNNSGAVLNDARLSLSLPEGAAFFGKPIARNIDNKNIGNVGIGSLIEETYMIVIFSSDNGLKRITANVSYSPASLGARFEKNESLDLKPQAAGISIEMSAPKKIISGEEFEITVNYKNISGNDFSDLELAMEYPPAFSFISASNKPDLNNNKWFFGDLLKNSEGELVIKGSVVGNNGDAFDFKAGISTRSNGEVYKVSQAAASTEIANSPIALSVSLNGSQDYAAKANDLLQYTISYINGTDIPLRNATIQAQLSGEMFDLATAQTNGFFRASDNALVWTADNAPALSYIAPGSAGAVIFSVKTKDNYPVRRFGDKNFVLRVNVGMESPTVPSGVQAIKTLSRAKLETKIGGNLIVDAKAYFRDADSGFLNVGPFPPKVGQKTNFTLHWQIRNLAADVSKVEVLARLGDNVKMVGAPKSNLGSLPEYDLSANTVIWKIDKLQANQGVVTGPVEAIFQIEVLPLAGSAGNYLPLIGITTIKANDDFIGKEVNNNDIGINTALPDDVTVSQQGGVIQP